MPPRPRTLRTLWPVTEDWKRQIQAELTRQRMTRIDLARSIGASHAAVSILLGPKTRSSKLVPAVHQALGLPPPRPAAARTELQHRWEMMYDKLDEEAVRQLLDLGERLSKSRA